VEPFSFGLGCGQSEARLAVGLFKLVAILAHVIPDLLKLLEIPRPLGYAVGGLLLLKTRQNGLVLNCDLHQLVLALNSVQTSLLHAHWVVKLRLGVLHNI